ncbi:hypothetical protein RHD99_14235 [Buttiauxella selenatireducens]|uniref:Lipoprotein n=1 Tax=Buttiauxella selenatireducens TaxID=3073902 RepID=A0ABY9S874_9ENTR|nr:putative T6SS immunity periplasmic lipoprotein [Buttiauxella sp. R73]WMY72636.1 hypothetical protein RHD99_14235 [Buttiauxella sp. R73]
MKKLLLPVCIFLMGCQSGADKLVYREWKWISVDLERVCFSVNKNDILDYYYLSSNKNNQVNELLVTGSKSLHLSYPDTCINIKLEKGYQYYSKYTLNGINYRYNFFIDNNWNVISLEGG